MIRGRWMLMAPLLAAACARVRPAVPAEPGCDGRCVVETFKEIAPIYRPSGEEGLIRQRLMQRIASASDRWPGHDLQRLGPDRAGNFLVRVPATGRFAGRGLPPVALQAHMDMVLAAADVPPGGDLRAWFRVHPVQIEEVGGRLRSRGERTSIGADNGVGCALLVRYALDPGLPHPPLELVFTIAEETGLRGAREYDPGALPLAAPVMISLDGFDATRLAHGSQGSRRRILRGALPGRPVAAGKLVQITATGLLGGHSGADIHRRRLNALVAWGAVARALLADPALALVEAIAGDAAGLNKIPTDLQLTIAAPASASSESLRRAAERALREAVAAHPGEAANPAVTVAAAELPATGTVRALSGDATDRLLATVLAFEGARPPLNGVVTSAPGYPDGVITSANPAWLEVRPGPGDHPTGFGFMIRSFSAAELAATDARMTEHLAATFAGRAPVNNELLSGYDPWLQDPGSWLVRLASPGFRSTGVQAIGVEPSYFAVKFPGLQIIGIGATITDAHTVHEAVSVQSILDITAALDALLIRLGDADAFRNAPARR
jgi:dipeptidase D